MILPSISELNPGRCWNSCSQKALLQTHGFLRPLIDETNLQIGEDCGVNGESSLLRSSAHMSSIEVICVRILFRKVLVLGSGNPALNPRYKQAKCQIVPESFSEL